MFPTSYDTNPARTIIIKGAGEMASGVAVRLYRAGFRTLLMLETPAPAAVRRSVSFCEAVYDGRQWVEGITARRAAGVGDIRNAWRLGQIAVAVDPEWRLVGRLRPMVTVDAVIAKRNLGTTRFEAPLVVALGPGFTAGLDAHCVIETNRGHDLGRVLTRGAAEANTGIPGNIGGFTAERVLRAPEAGVVGNCRGIGETVRAGETVCTVGGTPVTSKIDGMVRGCIRPGLHVKRGAKIGDVDPRGGAVDCRGVSEKARALGGGVLEAVCGHLCRVQASLVG